LLDADTRQDTQQNHETDRREPGSALSLWPIGGRKPLSAVGSKPARRRVERHPCHDHRSAAALRQPARQWENGKLSSIRASDRKHEYYRLFPNNVRRVRSYSNPAFSPPGRHLPPDLTSGGTSRANSASTVYA